MTQTTALLIDAYRELNAKKLFWITLLLSGLVVLAFACLGISETGMTLLAWDTPFSQINTDIISRELFYKSMFTGFGIQFWLAWLATILALVSTASIFPDLTTGGSIDLVLAKPISRWRLFLTKFLGGLLFVGLQVTVFTTASFLVIGVRGGAWEPGLFLAIPLVLIFFSYLFAICALLGLLTRSTIASLLLTLLLWVVLFSGHGTESWLLFRRTASEHEVTAVQAELLRVEEAGRDARGPNEFLVLRTAELREELAEAEEKLRQRTKWHTLAFRAMTCLPKTSETIGLLERWLIDLAELPDTREAENPPEAQMITGTSYRVNMQAVQKDVIEKTRERSVWWVLGTSLLCEAVVLGLGCFIFVRRDY